MPRFKTVEEEIADIWAHESIAEGDFDFPFRDDNIDYDTDYVVEYDDVVEEGDE